MIYYRTAQQQMNDIWAWGMAIIFMGLMFGMVRELLTGTVEKPALLPQTKVVTVTCPICGKVIEIHGYNAITRSEALKRHIQEKHPSKRPGKWTALLPRGISQEILQDESRAGQCYRLAYQFLAREKEGDLVHGRVWSGGRWIDHAWVETETGYVYEPVTDTFYKKADFYTATKAQVSHRYSVEQSMINLAKNNSYGPWESSLLPQVLIEGGEPVPTEYRYLTGWLREPLPVYSLLALPAVVPEVGERKIDAVLKQLKDGVESIQDSDKFRLFLSTMAKFHEYSIGNLILIAIQKPDATHVAGFNTWKDLGRWVKKGAKGIAILAPVMPPRPTCPECGARIPKGARFCPECSASVEEVETEITPRRFIVVYVFDIEQTEGKPLPEFEVPSLTGEVNEELFARVMTLANAQGLEVSFESRPQQDPSIKGQYFGKTIWVRPEEPRAQQLKTLLHEVAHYYSEGVFRIPRRDAETIAESAAFAVGAHFGFDTGVRSFPYVALWSEDKKVLEQNLAAIRKVATVILEALEPKVASPMGASR